jgi:hypothetical protein
VSEDLIQIDIKYWTSKILYEGNINCNNLFIPKCIKRLTTGYQQEKAIKHQHRNSLRLTAAPGILSYATLQKVTLSPPPSQNVSEKLARLSDQDDFYWIQSPRVLLDTTLRIRNEQDCKQKNDKFTEHFYKNEHILLIIGWHKTYINDRPTALNTEQFIKTTPIIQGTWKLPV